MAAEPSPFVHASANLLSPEVLADACAGRPRRAAFAPETFDAPGHDAPTAARLAEDIEAAFELARERYDAVRDRLATFPTPELRERWLIPLLQLLDFDPAFQRQHLQASPEDRATFGISHLGWGSPEAPPMILGAEALDGRPGPRRRSPHEELQAFLNRAHDHRWGLVADASELRLVRDFHHSRLKAFVGFDLRGIFEAGDFAGFRALYRLCHASRFVPRGEEKRPVLEELFEESQRQGVQVGRYLRPGVVRAIETIANGVLTPELRERLREGGDSARAFFAELLRLVYRVLFCLYAEQRGLLPAGGLYAEAYSLTRLREVAERHLADPNHHDLYEGLKATFRLLHRGAPEIGVYPYDGSLFDPAATPTLDAARLSNQALMEAVRALTSVEMEGVRQRVDFRYLGVDELGSVYESLLPYVLRVADRPTVVEGRPVEAGAAYLEPVSTERADLGAHYTRPEVVDLVLEVSLDRLIEERLRAAGDDPGARERAILGLKVVDPACGSGAFLVAAVDRLAAALARERAGGEQPTEEAMQRCRREVLGRCIYGVDKDPFAVELCKVSLWIHCAVKDLPLSFLDHRIQLGDSLVGWGPGGPPKEIPAEAFEPPSKADRELKAFLRSARERNRAVLSGQGELGEEPAVPVLDLEAPDLGLEEEASPGDVHRKAERYLAYLASDEYLRWKAAADIWTAAFFWDPASGEAPTSADYWRALRGQADPDLAARAVEICEVFPAFHWPLRFPEVLRRGGFDAVIGNPPWEQVKLKEEEWWAPRRRAIADLRGAERRRAIAALAESEDEEDRRLHRQWVTALQAEARVAECMRRCGRFTPSGQEANTYLLFTELAADLLVPGGRAGILVKSALALGKGAQPVFQRLLEGGRVEELHDIVNGGPTGTNLVFSGVDAKERFAVLGLRSTGGERAFQATVMNWNVEEARTRERRRFTPRELRVLNPRTRSLTSFRESEELEVALAIHRAFPTLDLEEGGSNPWGLSYHTLFHSSGDSHLFLKRDCLEAEGWVLGPDKVFRRGDEVALPVYEGQLANRYDHRARTYEGYAGGRKYERAPGIPETTDAQKADPSFEVEPRYWMLAKHAEARLAETVGEKVMIGFRDVSGPWREQRSAKGAILPRVPATHKLPVLAVDRDRAFEFLGVFNSTTFDFLVRGHMPGASVGLVWMLSQVAAPPPGLDPRIPEAAEPLSLTSYSVARIFGKDPYPWNPEERYELDVLVDALVAHAYQLTREQYEVVLDSFEVMAREQTRRFGSYRFKSDCLRAYDRVGRGG
ncbi:MAG TPA: DNA methyltransferase [Actinomycetota bacterium]|nr:DNA methyltransferase [Actinomycetota bacterium]